MKVTIDHNCIIHLRDQTDVGKRIKAIVHDHPNQCFVVNIGASEMRRDGVRPDRYERFEELLGSVGIAHLPRLDPLAHWGVTFWDRAVWANAEMIEASDAIRDVLFANSPNVHKGVGVDSVAERKWVNRICDVQGMWCHIQKGNEVFLTTDHNFMKATKLPKLIALGARRICHPCDL
jgi:hypothetical protein